MSPSRFGKCAHGRCRLIGCHAQHTASECRPTTEVARGLAVRGDLVVAQRPRLGHGLDIEALQTLDLVGRSEFDAQTPLGSLHASTPDSVGTLDAVADGRDQIVGTFPGRASPAQEQPQGRGEPRQTQTPLERAAGPRLARAWAAAGRPGPKASDAAQPEKARSQERSRPSR